MSKNELNLLLYLESCLVDGYGRCEGIKMNKEDFDIMNEWKNSHYIDYGRNKIKEIERLHKIRGKNFTHWVRLSEKAWIDAHAERKARSIRMIERMQKEATDE